MNRDERFPQSPPDGAARPESLTGDDRRAVRERFFKAFMASLKNITLYAPSHPASKAALDELAAAAGVLLDGSETIVLGLVGQEVVIDGEPLRQTAGLHARLTDLCHRKRFNKIVISKGITIEQLRNTFSILWKAAVEGPEEVNRHLSAGGVMHLRVDRLAGDDGESRKLPAGLEAADQEYIEGLAAVREFNALVRQQGGLTSGDVYPLATMLVRGVMENRGSLMTVLNIHTKDEYTSTHCLDVALLTLLQVARFRLDDGVLGEIAAAGILHDLGKTMVPDEVLNKPGKLDEEEWRIMERHPVWGAELIHDIAGVSELAMVAAFEHHQRYDNSGYPRRGSSRPQALLSQMVAIADVYDAMRSRRPYQQELPPEKAAGVLQRGAGTLFNPDLVRHFLGMVGWYGLGGGVRLTGGQVGIVDRNNPQAPERPVVRLLADETGEPVEPLLIDLSLPEAGERGVAIECSLPLDDRLRELLAAAG